MTAAFGEVTYEGGVAGEAAPPTEQVEISLDDPRLLSSENIEANEEGNAYAVPPPIPDGKWRAKLSAVDIKDSKGQPQKFIVSLATWKTPNVAFLCTNIQSEVLDASGKFDGVKLTEYWVKTLVGDRPGPGFGVSPLATIVRMSGGRVPQGSNAKQTMDAALAHLAGEPEAVIETQWEVSCMACTDAAVKSNTKKPKPFLRGMHRFPQTKVGVYSPEAQCPTCKSVGRAQPRITGYFPITTPHN